MHTKAGLFPFRQMEIQPWLEDIMITAVQVLPGSIPVQQGYGRSMEVNWRAAGQQVIHDKAFLFPFRQMEIQPWLEAISITVVQALPGSLFR